MNSFTRGLDPKEAMGIGIAGILKEINGRIIDEKQFKEWKKFRNVDYSENVLILVSKGKYSILKNVIKFDDPALYKLQCDLKKIKGPESELLDILLKLRDGFRKYGANFFFFPSFQKVAAKTIGLDLVSVQPMSAPLGISMYVDYQYNKQSNKIIGNGPI
jgi:hypothetical protein